MAQSLPLVSCALDAEMHTPAPTSAIISEDRTHGFTVPAASALRQFCKCDLVCFPPESAPLCVLMFSLPHPHLHCSGQSLPHAFASGGEFCLACEPLLCCAVPSLPIEQSPSADLWSEGSQPDLRAQTQLPEGSRVLMCPHPACGALIRNLPQGPRSFLACSSCDWQFMSLGYLALYCWKALFSVRLSPAH